MGNKFGYTVLIVLNMATICFSLHSIFVLKHNSSFISLGIGIVFLFLSIREINKL